MTALKLNDEMIEKICEDIKRGVPIIYAAEANGICQTTFYVYYNKGKEEESGKYRDFYNAVEEAKAEAIALRARRIYKAGQAYWQADAWWLERVDREHFGRKDHIELKSESKVKVSSLKEEEEAAEEYFKKLDEEMQ